MSTFLNINKQKIRADNFITIFLVIGYLFFALFLRIEGLMGVIVYPFAALFALGIIKIISSLNRRNRGENNSFRKILIGLLYIIFSAGFLSFLFSFSNVTTQVIVNLVAFPITIVGISAIIKGIIIKVYSLKFRIINIIIGNITIILCFFTYSSPNFLPKSFFLFDLIVLSIALFFNVLGRAGIYLSEFGLSLLSLRNLKIFFYIISDYLLQVDENGNLLLEKIEATK
ncbi:MAG: hypothetical protein ACFFB0_04425 [Promethearchaeota archaeon]